jgi:hypothetical protein
MQATIARSRIMPQHVHCLLAIGSDIRSDIAALPKSSGCQLPVSVGIKETNPRKVSSRTRIASSLMNQRMVVSFPAWWSQPPQQGPSVSWED